MISEEQVLAKLRNLRGFSGARSVLGGGVKGVADTCAQDLAAWDGAGGVAATSVRISEALDIVAVRVVHFCTACMICIVASAWVRVVASINLCVSSSLLENEDIIVSVRVFMESESLLSKWVSIAFGSVELVRES